MLTVVTFKAVIRLGGHHRVATGREKCRISAESCVVFLASEACLFENWLAGHIAILATCSVVLLISSAVATLICWLPSTLSQMCFLCCL